MQIINEEKYRARMKNQSSWSNRDKKIYQKIIPVLTTGLLGALAWAIRGTTGFGGTTGALVAGLMIGSFLVYLAYIYGIDARNEMILLGIGLGLGGFNGYGQFISWIFGNFNVSPGEKLPIAPAIGFLWLFIIGLEWGGIGGVMLRWNAEKEVSKKQWVFRIIIPIIAFILGMYFVRWNKEWIYPYYSPEFYASETYCINCAENIKILPIVGGLFALFLSLSIMEQIFNNKDAVKSGMQVGLFFGIAFSFCGMLFYLYNISNVFDWWKLWEESIGFIGGISIGMVFIKKIPALNQDLDESLNKTKIQPQKENLNEYDQTLKSTDANSIRTSNGSKRNNRLAWKRYNRFNLVISILIILLIGGLSHNICRLFGNNPDMDYSDILKSNCRIAFYSIALVIALFFFFCLYKKGREKRHDSKELFIITNINDKIIHVMMLYAFIGIAAVNSIPVMINYFVIFWMIISLVLLMQKRLENQDSAV